MSQYDFGTMFIEAKGKPILYRGRQLVLADYVPAKLGQVLEVTIESTNSPHLQGVGISTGLKVFGEQTKNAVIWEYVSLDPKYRDSQRSNLPFQFQVECRNKQGHLSFYNIAELNGRQEWWTNGSCMFIESLHNGRRYHCNDFEFNDDFDDLIFKVEW